MAEEEPKGIRKFLKKFKGIRIPKFRRISRKKEEVVRDKPLPKKNGGNGGNNPDKHIEKIQHFLNSRPEYEGIAPRTVADIMTTHGLTSQEMAANVAKFEREREAAEIEKAERRNNARNPRQLSAPQNTNLPLVREPWRIREEVRKQREQAKIDKQRRIEFAGRAFTITDHKGWTLNLGFVPLKRELSVKWGVIPSVVKQGDRVQRIRARIPGLPNKIDTLKKIGSDMNPDELAKLIELMQKQDEINRLDDLITKEGQELDRTRTPKNYRRIFAEENARNMGQTRKGFLMTGHYGEFMTRTIEILLYLTKQRQGEVSALRRRLIQPETEALLKKYETEFQRYRSANYESERIKLASAKEDERNMFRAREKTLSAREEQAREEAKARAKLLAEQKQLEAEFAAQKKNDRAGARSEDKRSFREIQMDRKLLQGQFRAIGKRKGNIQSLEKRLETAEKILKKRRQREKILREERLAVEQNKAFARRIKPAENFEKKNVDKRGTLNILLSDKLENLQAIRTYVARWEDAYRKQGKDPATLKISSGEMDRLIEFYKTYKHTRNEISELEQKIQATSEEIKRNPERNERNKELAGVFYRLSAERNRRIQEFRANHRPGIEGTLNKYAQLRFQGEMKAVEKVVRTEDMFEKHREARAERVAEQIERLKTAERMQRAHAHH